MLTVKKLFVDDLPKDIWCGKELFSAFGRENLIAGIAGEEKF